MDLTLGFPLLDALRGCSAVLDVGCGPQGWSWIRLLGPERLQQGVGLDSFRPSFEAPPGLPRWSSYVLAQGDKLPFREKSFDATIGIDFIEHLTKPSALEAVSEMKRVSRKAVVIVTPNGFLPQSGGVNPAQEHRSGWTKPELEALGFRVVGLRGLRSLRGEYASPTVSPPAVGLALSLASSPLVRMRPSVGFQLLGKWTAPAQ